jgi:hypothetical protein
MKKIVKWFMLVLGIGIFMSVLSSCAKETTNFTAFEGAVKDYRQEWSSTIKGDTVIFENAQILRVNYGNRGLVLRPNANVRVYPKKDTIMFDEASSLTPVLEDSQTSKDTRGMNPIVTTFTKEFTFSDTQTVCADIMFETFILENETSSFAMPTMSITSIDFVSSSIKEDTFIEGLYYVELNFKFNWEVTNLNQKGSENLTIEYTKHSSAQDSNDTLIETTFKQGCDWITSNSIVLYIEKIDVWKNKGERKERYITDPLEISFTSSSNKTISVDNFNFTLKKEKAPLVTRDLCKENWCISENIISEKHIYTNGTDSFFDEFTYSNYIISCYIWGKTFEFDLDTHFTSYNELTIENDTTAINKTIATFSIASQTFDKDVITTLELRQEEPTPTPPSPTYPTHGRIISHHVSAIFDVQNNTTKKCIVIRYEKGYDWGVCDYEEDFPTIFTYTQSGYSGFNSVAIKSGENNYRLARAVDTSNVIYWYAENNTLLSAIDAITCKVIGWKNIVNGKYCSKMDSYVEEYTDDNYTLTLTSKNGQTRTFHSSKADYI